MIVRLLFVSAILQRLEVQICFGGPRIMSIPPLYDHMMEWCVGYTYAFVLVVAALASPPLALHAPLSLSLHPSCFPLHLVPFHLTSNVCFSR